MSVDARKTAVLAVLLAILTGAPVAVARGLWDGVVAFDPGFSSLFEGGAGAPERAVSEGVTLVLVDGLRLDNSKNLPFLNELRRRGASFDATIGTPSFSRPGRATIVTGAWPSVHGVTTNRQRRPMALDNLLRRVADAGRRCRVAGSPIWSSLFAEEIAKCGSVRDERTKEGPGTFARVVPEVRASQESALAFVTESPADLRLLDILSTDFASHEFGGASPEAVAESQRADDWIRRIAGQIDLTRATLAVTADHGHIHLDGHGGHGGDEPEVLAVPIVFVGAGVKPGAHGRAEHVDIAPTVAALLGLPAPASAEGRTLVEALTLDAAAAGRVRAEDDRRRAVTARVIAKSVGVAEPSDGDWRSSLLEATRAERSAPGVAAAVFILSLTVVCLRLVGRGDRLCVAGGALLALAIGSGALSFIGDPLSLSAINYDEQVTAYFGRIAALVAASSFISIALCLVGSDRSSRPRNALAIGVLTGLVLLAGYLFIWAREGLQTPRFLPDVASMTEAFVLLIARTAAGTAAFAYAATAAVLGRARA